jgi:hypothetical protein
MSDRAIEISKASGQPSVRRASFRLTNRLRLYGTHRASITYDQMPEENPLRLPEIVRDENAGKSDRLPSILRSASCSGWAILGIDDQLIREPSPTLEHKLRQLAPFISLPFDAVDVHTRAETSPFRCSCHYLFWRVASERGARGQLNRSSGVGLPSERYTEVAQI